MKKGFTLIELMIVIAILAVLLGIITTVASASMRKARERRTQAMLQTLQNGIAAYRERMDKWPGKLENVAKDRTNDETYTLTDDEYDSVVQELLKVSGGKNPKNRVLDPVGLLVMRVGGSRAREYREVTKKNGKYGKRMSANEMTVVYSNADDGTAKRFHIRYSGSENVTVTK